MTQKDPSQKHQLIADAKQRVTVGGTYVHFKDPSKQYTVTNVGIIEATEEACVMYEAQYEELKGLTWVRPLSNFLEEVEWEGKKVPRFHAANP